MVGRRRSEEQADCECGHVSRAKKQNANVRFVNAISCIQYGYSLFVLYNLIKASSTKIAIQSPYASRNHEKFHFFLAALAPATKACERGSHCVLLQPHLRWPGLCGSWAGSAAKATDKRLRALEFTSTA